MIILLRLGLLKNKLRIYQIELYILTLLYCYVSLLLSSVSLGQRVKGPDHIGKVLICGATNWDLVARKAVPKGCKTANKGRDVYTPHRFAPLNNIRAHMVVSGCNAAHSVIITDNWKVLLFG